MSILDEIFAHKRDQVARQKMERPVESVRTAAERADEPRDFVGALRQNVAQPALIAEIKRASPSRGPLVEDFDPLQLAHIYQRNGAAAISVLTDARYFQGHLSFLTAVRRAVQLPVLRKDFVFDQYQVYEARAAGADAILLIVAMLEDYALRGLYRLTRSLGMEALVEVHDEEELARALQIEPRLVGINNRNLHTFEVDLETTARLRPLIPPEAAVVAESGIHTPADVSRLAAIGADAMLVGESLVVAQDTGAQVRRLAIPSATRVKICGFTNLPDAHAALDAGADMLGFNFYPQSKRYIEPARCAAIVKGLRDHGAPVTTVGVFVNASRDEVASIMTTCGLDLAQIHGDEPPEFVAAFGGQAFKGLRPESPDGARSDATRFARAEAPALLVDARRPGEYGGTGHTGDWDLARELAAQYPILLAGGLTPDNVTAAVAQVHPWGVDVASGVESSPGKKDAGKMAVFVKAARERPR